LTETYFLSVQDGRVRLVDGTFEVLQRQDTLAVLRLRGDQLDLLDVIALPGAITGPPTSIALNPRRTRAVVSAATRLDPADPTRIVPGETVSLVALEQVGPPRVLATFTTGAGATGVAIHPDGKLLLVANAVADSLSVMSIAEDRPLLKRVIQLPLGSAPVSVLFTPDGDRALVTRRGDHRISLLNVDQDDVHVDPREIFAGLRPYGLALSPDGRWAACGNLGGGQGDIDTISLIDLHSGGPRVVDTASVGQTPEGIEFAPDGLSVVVTVVNGSNHSRSSPNFGEARIRQFRVQHGRLLPAGDARCAGWPQGLAFAKDGAILLVQTAEDESVTGFHRTPDALTPSTIHVAVHAAPAAIARWR